jgi:type I restriction enzyme S subunit
MKLPAYPKTKPSLPAEASAKAGVVDGSTSLTAGWLGDVPEHWEVKRLKIAAHLTDKKVEADEENPVPYIGMENIESWTGRLLPINPDVVPTGTANAFKAGHTLFGKLRPYLAKACNPDFDGLCSTELLVLNGVEFDRDSLRYTLLSEGFIKLVDSSTYGSKMPRASWDFIGNCIVPIAPPPEQRAIAAFLDRETGRIDRLVAKKRELIERLQEKRSALISRTVTRGLPAEAATKAGLPVNPPMKDSGLDWLGEIPAHWEVKKLGYGAYLQGGYAFASEKFDSEGVPVVRMSNLKRGVLDTSDASCVGQENCLDDFALAEGDLLWGMSGSIGETGSLGNFARARACDLPAQLNQRVGRFCVIGDSIALCFLTCVIQTEFFYDQILLRVTGTAQFNVSSEQVQSVKIPFPPLAEQAAIAAYLDAETAKLDALVGKVEQAIERLQEYRTALITAAVTGKVDVRTHSKE